jgi:hypothetical protein
MPERVDIINSKGQKLILSHAGCDPWVTDEEARLSGLKDRYIWDRKHIFHYDLPFKEKAWENTYVIHGHTPVITDIFSGDEDIKLPYEKEVKAIHYANGHKICIDMGTPFTGVTCLINLDTFEEHYFYEKAE